jgi:hypothetical protein
MMLLSDAVYLLLASVLMYVGLTTVLFVVTDEHGNRRRVFAVRKKRSD